MNCEIQSPYSISESNTDSSRKLASIQLIEHVEKHSNADALELVTILGWQVITRIGEVIPGTKVIYCEIDSMLPINALWLPPAIRDRIIKERTKDYFRVKTIKLRGELSQGLIIPIIDTLPPVCDWNELGIGHDVTSSLQILKYEPPALTGKFSLYFTANSNNVSNFPTHLLNKTDEQRIQSCPKLFRLLRENPYYMTVKLDGTSATYLIDPNTHDFVVCSRNLIRTKPDNLNLCPYWYIASKYNLESKLKQFPHLAIQGEICGPNIQRNLLKLKDLNFFVFNLVDIRDKSLLPFPKFISMCKEDLQLPHVPIEEANDIFLYDNIRLLLTKAKGLYHGTKNPREGLVIRSMDQSISFKAINNDYLLRYGH